MPKPTISFGRKKVYKLSDGLGLWGAQNQCVRSMRIKVHLGSHNQQGRTSRLYVQEKVYVPHANEKKVKTVSLMVKNPCALTQLRVKMYSETRRKWTICK